MENIILVISLIIMNWSKFKENSMPKTIEIKSGDKFLITGYYYNSKKKFRMIVDSWAYANQINLWNGHVWLISKETGKKTLLKTVVN
jgi:hypothetical protein